MGTYKVSVPLALFAVTGVILAAMYILLPYQKMFTGPINPQRAGLADLDGREKLVVSPLIVGMVVLGIWSAPLVGSLQQISENLEPNITFVSETAPEVTGSPALGIISPSSTADLNEGNAQ